MFKIYDGREQFYQWDIDRKLIVDDATIAQVHFCNRTDDCSLVCKTYKENGLVLVNVPNVLLQDNWRINVYAYDGKYTKHSDRFEVIPRSKPDDYVYTETEILRWERLESRIDEIEENGVSGEMIQNTVDKYLKDNPIDLEGYATEKYVDEAIERIDVGNMDLSNYYTKAETNSAITSAIGDIPEVDLSKYATKSYVSTQIALNEPNLGSYATKDYVSNKIAEAQLSGDGDADLSNYYTKTEVNNTFATKDEIPSTAGLATKSYVDKAVESVSIDTAGLATETFVENQIAAIEHPKTDLSNYYTKSETKAQISSSVPDMSLYATKTYVGNQIAANEVDLTGYATQEYVSNKIAEAQLGDGEVNLDGYYTKTETDAAITSAVGSIVIPEVDLSDYAKKNEIPTIPTKVSVFTNDANYATKSYVDTAVDNIKIPEGSDVDLDNYYTKAETNELIPDMNLYATKTYVNNAIANNPGGGGGGDIEEVYVGTEEPTNTDALVWINPEGDVDDDIATIGYVDEAIASLEVDVDLTGYATEEYVNGKTNGLATTEYVDNAIDNVDVDLTGYATEKYVDDAIAAIDIPEGGGGAGGSVAVDNATIVQNNDGTISTVLGGSKVLTAPGELKFDEPNGTFTGSLFEVTMAARPQYTLGEVECYVKYTITKSDGTILVGKSDDYIGDDSFIFTFSDGVLTQGNVKRNAMGTFQLTPVNASDFTTSDTIAIQFYTADAYSYVPYNANFTPVDNSTIGVVAGAITLPWCSLDNKILDIDHLVLKGLNLDMGSGSCSSSNISYYSPVNIGYTNTVSASGGSITLGIGYGNTVSGGGFALGNLNNVSANRAIALGLGLKTGTASQLVLGQYNEANTYPITIGVGGGSGSPRNGLTIDSEANVVIGGTISSSGADYAEYFEWADGNPNNEDRVGYIVALEGNKIRLATGSDDVLGIISGTATVLGDDAEWNWKGKYLKDNFGRIIYEDKEIFEEDAEGNLVSTGYHSVPVINPEYNPEEKYIPRKDRAEWDAVGMMGKLYVRDDGSADVGDYVFASNGVATISASLTNMRVLERISPDVIRVLLKG